jgi:hypothetical protein
MLQIFYKPTEETFYPEPELESLSGAILMTNVFEADIYLLVNGVNIFGFPNGTTMSLPLVGFAHLAEKHVWMLGEGEMRKVMIETWGDLYLEQLAGRLRLYTTTLRRHMMTDLGEARREFSRFARQVKMDFERELPAITRNPAWPIIFPDR